MSQANKAGLDLMFCYSCYILSFDYSMANISFFRHIIYLSVKIYGFGERGNDNAHLFFPFRYPKSQNLYVALWRKGVTASCLCLLVKGNQVRILSCTRSCMSIKAFGFFMPLNVGVFGKVSENRRISQKTCLALNQ